MKTPKIIGKRNARTNTRMYGVIAKYRDLENYHVMANSEAEALQFVFKAIKSKFRKFFKSENYIIHELKFGEVLYSYNDNPHYPLSGIKI